MLLAQGTGRREDGMNRKLVITTAAAGAAIAALAPATVQAAPPGTCRLTAHLQFVNGSYSADSSSVECAGVINGQPVHGGGFLQEWGTYSESGCTLTWRDNTFFARIPEAIEFFGPTYIDSEGGFTFTGSGPVMPLSGSGDNDGQPFLAQGVAQFTSDTGGCDVHSGTLAQTFTLTDGGNGNPAAADAINRYERVNDGQADAGGASSVRSAPSKPVATAKKHRHHHKFHKARRAARARSR
jgi:hypothetical protein